MPESHHENQHLQEQQNMALLAAVVSDDVPAIDRALRRGADIDFGHGLPLGTAAYHGYEGATWYLVERGADLTIDNGTVLLHAVHCPPLYKELMLRPEVTDDLRSGLLRFHITRGDAYPINYILQTAQDPCRLIKAANAVNLAKDHGYDYLVLSFERAASHWRTAADVTCTVLASVTGKKTGMTNSSRKNDQPYPP